MLDVSYPNLLSLFPEHIDRARRTESASFLIWYLENFYRLDGQEATDAVCDQPGDKGVDGIYVNENNQTITIFQSKISQNSNTTIGDRQLKDFAGTLNQFKDSDSIKILLDTARNTHLANLLKLHDIEKKIISYNVIGEFLTNIEIDSNGSDYFKHINNINFVGRSHLISEFISTNRDVAKTGTAYFDVFGIKTSEYIVSEGEKAVIAPVRAVELIKLDGIADQSLFTYNVRGSLGRTAVNKSIVSSIKNK